MRVSFIIPVQKFKACLLETLKAVGELQGLSKENYEILVIQNGPKASIPSWIKDNGQVQCFHVKESSIPKARNFGLHHGQFEYVCYLDEDSVCSPKWLEEALYFVSHKNVGAYQSPSWRKNKILRFEEHYLKTELFNGTILFDTGASFFKKEALLAVEGFDETFKRVEDLDLAMRLANNGWIISYGTLVVGGTDRPSTLQGIYNFVESIFHSKRLVQKHHLLAEMKVFPKDFRLIAKRPPLKKLIERTLFYLFRPSKNTQTSLQMKSRYVVIFLDNKGKSFLIKSRFCILITVDAVIFILDKFRVFTTTDKYIYAAVLSSEKKIELELDSIQDKAFIERIIPFMT
jgi:glycosyltransferase involved in cell wall biosynthesis